MIGVITIMNRTKKRTIPEANSRLSEAASRTVCPNPVALTAIGLGVLMLTVIVDNVD